MSGLYDQIILDRASAFEDQILGQHASILPGLGDSLEWLMPWDRFSRLVEMHAPHRYRIRMAYGHGGETLEPFVNSVLAPSGDLKPQLLSDVVSKHLRRGATLIFTGVDEVDPTIRELAEEFQRALAEPVTVNAYASFGTADSFGLHWDDHDVFALQIHGRKQWDIYGPTREHPLHRDVGQNHDPPRDVLRTDVLESGSIYYVPQGWWHRACALGEPSLHLTVGFSRRTGIDLLGWVVDKLRDNVELRRPLTASGKSVGTAEYLELVRVLVSEQLNDRVIADFLEHRQGVVSARPRVSFPWVGMQSISLDESVRLLAPQGVPIHLLDDARARIRLHGRDVEFPTALMPTVDLLAEGESTAVSLLAAGVPDVPVDYLLHFLDALLREGLLEVLANCDHTGE